MATAKGSAGLSEYYNTVIFCGIIVSLKCDARQTSGQFLISGCPRREKKHMCFAFKLRNDANIFDTAQIYKRKSGEGNIVKGLSKCANTRHFFILSKWVVSSRVLHSKSRSACRCVFSKTITVLSVFLVLRDTDLFFLVIPLLFFIFALPEKQSSSAVAWASPGCHVFLKGCLRGTLQTEPFLITCSIRLSSFWFSLTSSTWSPQFSQWNANVLNQLVPMLSRYCLIATSACSN